MAGSNHFFTSTTMLYLVFLYVHLLLFLRFSGVAVSQSIIQSLPGFVGALPFELETGYVSVDDSNDVQLFYYFVKSENNPTEDPLIVWFTGGPGCSVLTALMFENGPLYFKHAKYNGSLPTLMLNPNSWTKISNILYVDAPVGTGFSYSRSLEGSFTSDTKSAKQSYIFIRKWLMHHPEFFSNPLYICGDSYAGMVVPIIVQDISDGIEIGHKPSINLKGYLLGNPATDRHAELNSQIHFFHHMGILSDELLESAKKHCKGEYVKVDPSNVQCIKDLQAVSQCTAKLNPSHILEPSCGQVWTPKCKKIIRDRNLLEKNLCSNLISLPPIPLLKCRNYGHMLSYYWANNDGVRKALNVRKGTVQEWTRCNLDGINYLKNVKTSTGYHLSISKRHYRSLIYSGDHDANVPFFNTQTWIRSLNYSIIDEWRPWFVDGQIGGTYANQMTFATVKGGGHTAPEYRPNECFNMFKRWLSYEPL
ncbi:hypothetical protein AQUCO_06000059v1 [Aquilegia coerulea]|uniref:Uncharacterized protein n=1 Tax=Aquilegia coerulea TaxID=218851 RepID=A0A2G5CF12_AQUCA|nr:hypothetical protein AQUCO_06000059v1 [Aquilegia coerulea]